MKPEQKNWIQCTFTLWILEIFSLPFYVDFCLPVKGSYGDTMLAQLAIRKQTPSTFTTLYWKPMGNLDDEIRFFLISYLNSSNSFLTCNHGQFQLNTEYLQRMSCLFHRQVDDNFSYLRERIRTSGESGILCSFYGQILIEFIIWAQGGTLYRCFCNSTVLIYYDLRRYLSRRLGFQYCVCWVMHKPYVI